MDVRRDDFAHVTADLQGFVDANHEALKALAAAGKLSSRRSAGKNSATLVGSAAGVTESC